MVSSHCKLFPFHSAQNDTNFLTQFSQIGVVGVSSPRGHIQGMEGWSAQQKRGSEQNRAFIFLFIVLIVRGGVKLDFWKYLRFCPNWLDHQFAQA